MLEIFALGTIWFWMLCGAAFVIITAFVEAGYPGRATWAVILFFALVHFLGGLKFVNWVIENPGVFFSTIAVYFVVGTIYCLIKWYFFLLNKKDEYKKNDEVKKSRTHYGNAELPLKPSDYRYELVGWIIYWPFSCVWTIINDPVKRIATSIYLQIEGILQKMSDNVFKDVLEKKDNKKI